MDRNLTLIEKNGYVIAQFTKYCSILNPPEQTVKRLLTQREAAIAREIIKSKDPHAIDGFCYSIA